MPNHKVFFFFIFPLYLQWKEYFTTVTFIHYLDGPFYDYLHFVFLLIYCAKVHSCKCKLDDGTVIDLSPIGSKTGEARQV
jgi:hypothetical protein